MSRSIPVPAAPAGHEYRTITVDRYAGACGAVVGGVDLAAELDDDVDRRDPARAPRPPGDLLPRAVAHARAAGRVQPPVRAVQPGAVRRADRRASRGHRGRARAERAGRARVRRLVALRLLVPARAADGLDPARDRGAAVRRRHDLGQPVPRVRGAVAGDARRRRAAARRAQRGERVLAEDAGDPRPVRRHDRADERRREPHAGASRRAACTRRRRKPALFVNAQYTIGLAGFRPHESKLAARLPVPALDATRVHVPVAVGRRATSRSGTTAACSTW